jgi:two-component system chemotaxis response regulator CheB
MHNDSTLKAAMPVTLLLVDDSPVIRGLMSRALARDPDIHICGTAANGEIAIAVARSCQPDVIVLDIDMPVMDGITALPHLLGASPRTKIIMASALTLGNAQISLRALSLGATDLVAKPSLMSGRDADVFYRELIAKAKALGSRVIAPQVAVLPRAPLNPKSISALAIAASTGGPQALMRIFADMKGSVSSIPIFITQHMPATFTALLAEQLSKAGARPCMEGKSGELVQPGFAYIAPGDFHMQAQRNAMGATILSLNQQPEENYCRPSADPMLRSLAEVYGDRLAVLVLTGMGQDGLEGARAAAQYGGSIIAQDAASCTVYGMPKAVVDHKLAGAVLPLADIGAYLVGQVDGGG